MSRNGYTRRAFLKRSGLGLAALSFLSCDFLTRVTGKNKPNILFAIADDWAWPHAGAYGDKVVQTPTFDRVAQNGILFNNAFVSAPSCTPSRNAILTGQYHWRLGSGASLHSKFPDEAETYPNILEDDGYFVGSYRKAFGPGQDRRRPVAGKKIDSFEAFLQAQPKDKPFCFWFGSKDPHRTYEWESGVNSGMKLEDVDVPSSLPDNKEIRTDICDYYWEVQRFDREVGQALELLEKTGQLHNTIIIVTSDNGWPFPRGKSNLYDLGVHVPLAIQWEGNISKGRIVEDFVSLSDFAPTFLEAAGMKPLSAMTGKSLISIFKSEESGWIEPGRDHVLTGKERHTPAQVENAGGTPMRAIRNQDFLYIHNFKPDRWPAGAPMSRRGKRYGDIDNGPSKSVIIDSRDNPKLNAYFELSCGKRPTDELYDLKKDPHQVKNVADKLEYAGILKKLKNQLMHELADTEDPRASGNGDVFDNYTYLRKSKKKHK